MSDRNSARIAAAACRRAVLALAAAALGLLAVAAVASAAAPEVPGETFAASVNAAGEFAGGEGTGVFTPVSISADGRYVAFESAAANFGEAGPGGSVEGFVKDLATGAVALVTRAEGPAGAPAGEPGIEDLRLSADGRYVVFTSAATNLGPPLPGEEAGEPHVYRRDLETGATVLVDRVSGAGGPTFSRAARAEAISADGRYVLFAASVANLEDAGGDHAETAFPVQYVRDTVAATTTAVSRADGVEGELADEASEASSISADGRYVAFASTAGNLPGATGESQVYLRDLQGGTTTLVSANPSGQAGDRGSFFPAAIGGRGCEVEFSSLAFDLVEPTPAGEQVYVRDLCASPPTTTLVSESGGTFAGLAFGAWGSSGDGNLVLFGASFDPSGAFHLFVADRTGGAVSQIDRASGDGVSADGEPQQAAIAANGCRVAFGSQATNLAGPPPQAPGGEPAPEVYVRQLAPCAADREAPAAGSSNRQAPEDARPAATGLISGSGGPQKSLRIAGLDRRGLTVELGGPGEVTVRLRRLVPRPRRRWPLLRTLSASAGAPGPVAVRLGRLAPGRYRLNVWLRGTGTPGTVRFLEVGGGRQGRLRARLGLRARR
jgi:Tol biopolymer transport system component